MTRSATSNARRRPSDAPRTRSTIGSIADGSHRNRFHHEKRLPKEYIKGGFSLQVKTNLKMSSNNVTLASGFNKDRFGVLLNETPVPAGELSKEDISALVEKAKEQGCHCVRGKLELGGVLGEGARLHSVADGKVGFVVPVDGDRSPAGATSSMSISALVWKVEEGSRRILVVKCANRGYWAAVAGGVDAGENMLEAMRREVSEETSLEVDLFTAKFVALGEMNDRFNGSKNVLYTLSVQLKGSDVPELQKTEVSDYRWVSQEEYDSLVSFKSARAAADIVFDGGGIDMKVSEDGTVSLCAPQPARLSVLDRAFSAFCAKVRSLMRF
jgi:8-oxo-dGTP pyrophosphatase MutT (NUDIX family)